MKRVGLTRTLMALAAFALGGMGVSRAQAATDVFASFSDTTSNQ